MSESSRSYYRSRDRKLSRLYCVSNGNIEVFGEPGCVLLKRFNLKECRIEYLENVREREFYEALLLTGLGVVSIILLSVLRLELDSWWWQLAFGPLVIGVALMWNHRKRICKLTVKTADDQFEVHGDRMDHLWMVFVGNIMPHDDTGKSLAKGTDERGAPK